MFKPHSHTALQVGVFYIWTFCQSVTILSPGIGHCGSMLYCWGSYWFKLEYQIVTFTHLSIVKQQWSCISVHYHIFIYLEQYESYDFPPTCLFTTGKLQPPFPQGNVITTSIFVTQTTRETFVSFNQNCKLYPFTKPQQHHYRSSEYKRHGGNNLHKFEKCTCNFGVKSEEKI